MPKLNNAGTCSPFAQHAQLRVQAAAKKAARLKGKQPKDKLRALRNKLDSRRVEARAKISHKRMKFDLDAG